MISATLFSALCATLLGVVAIEQDTVLGPDNPPPFNEDYEVFGDATLTVLSGAIGEVKLRDDAKLVIDGGELRDNIIVYGNNDIQMLSGVTRDSVVGNGNSTVYVADGFGMRGTTFNYGGGTHHIEVNGFRMMSTTLAVYGSHSDITVDMYADSPYYHNDSSGFRAGQFCWNSSCSALTVRDVKWFLHDKAERLPGDTNNDGVVDLADLNEVRNRFGRPMYGIDLQLGDTLPFDGQVDLNDLNVVRNSFGATLKPVPEPATGLLLAAAITCLIAFNRKHS